MRKHSVSALTLALLLGAAPVKARAQDVPPSPPPAPDSVPAVPPEQEKQPGSDTAPPETAPPVEAAPPPPPAVVPPLATEPASKPAEKSVETKWYDRINLRGYTQVRYNRLPSFDRNDKLINEQGDRSIGDNNSFLIRRARLIISGEIHPRLSIYLQPDFASAINDQLHVAILRDWYADIFLDADKEFRIRLGQSKVPYGFENLQSSQNRAALDRNDALNSAVKDERDLGIFVYWAPDFIRKRFKYLVDSGLKGSGDYGVVGLGVFNGQTANRRELNDNLHAVARVTWPFELGSQFLEVGGGGYFGKYTVALADQGGVTYTTTDPDNTLTDARLHGSVVFYPRPFGFSAEYTYGKGPQQGRADPTLIDSRKLRGGYAQVMFRFEEPFGTTAITPYARGTIYDGGKKFQTNAPYYEVREVEGGVEWQLNKWIEVTLAYQFANRTSDKAPYAKEKGQVTRVQVQLNY